MGKTSSHRLLLAAAVLTLCLGWLVATESPVGAQEEYPFQTFHEGYGGIQGNDQYGTSFAVGDFDGDGHQDLAVGAVAQDTPTGADQGVVEVIPGNGAGLDIAGRYTLMDPEGTGDSFGAALAAGDFDGNGVDDLVVGVPNEDSGKSNNGIIYVLYGAPGADLVVSPDRARHAVLWQDRVDDHIGTGLTIDPTNDRVDGDRFGAVLAVGNFNGDQAEGTGYEIDDLVVGIPNEDSSQGAILVLFGIEAVGLDRTNPTDWSRYFTQADFASTRANNEQFGAALAVGDFNGDGTDDIAIGTPFNAGARYGSAHLLYGDPSDLYEEPYAPDPGIGGFTVGENLSQTPAGLGASEADDWFGSALAAGDFDGDGTDDLAIGSPGEDVGDTVDAGEIGVLYGGPPATEGTPGDGKPLPNGLVLGEGQRFDQVLSGLGEDETGDRFGSTLRAGEFVGGSPDDLVIGIPFEDSSDPVVADSGQVAILYGGFAAARAAASIPKTAQEETSSAPRDLVYYEGRVFDQTDVGGNEGAGAQDLGTGDRFGLVLGSGLISGRSAEDLFIGVPWEDWTGVVDSGVVHLGMPWPRTLCGRLAATIVGTLGDDVLLGTPGRDVIVGLSGDDDIAGYGGNDLICGGPGSDLIEGGDGNDRIYGNDGDDEIYGDAGADKLYGGPGFDTLDGGSEGDLIKGGPNGDFLVSGPGPDTVKAGNGADTISYEWAGGGVVVSLADRTTTGADTDTVAGVEHVEGSLFDDVLTGSPAVNKLWGLSGDDMLRGAAGNDTLLGGDGDDSAIGGLGNDTCEAETRTTCEH